MRTPAFSSLQIADIIVSMPKVYALEWFIVDHDS